MKSAGRWAEDFADFAGEALQGEGFLQESFWGFGDARGGEGFLGVAGEVEDFDAGARGEELSSGIRPRLKGLPMQASWGSSVF